MKIKRKRRGVLFERPNLFEIISKQAFSHEQRSVGHVINTDVTLPRWRRCCTLLKD